MFDFIKFYTCKAKLPNLINIIYEHQKYRCTVKMYYLCLKHFIKKVPVLKCKILIIFLI